jgi:hypothetical protein
MNHYIAFTSIKREDRRQYEGIIRDFSRKHRLTVRELTDSGIPLRRAAIGLAEISIKAGVIVKSGLCDKKAGGQSVLTRRRQG